MYSLLRLASSRGKAALAEVLSRISPLQVPSRTGVPEHELAEFGDAAELCPCEFPQKLLFLSTDAVGALDFLDDRLAELASRGLLREDRSTLDARLDVCSNDYLGYGRTPVSRATLLACEAIRTGAGASRLIHGTTSEHRELEAAAADWVGLPRALLFSSGYAANVGLLSALCQRGDLVVSDRLNHASIIDGVRLSRAEVAVVPHADVGAVEDALAKSKAARKWVVTESYFSMDGDVADLRALREACDRHGAGLIVDEAHALGVHGPEGAGLCRQFQVTPDALVGTLGKAVGGQGAFVAGGVTLRAWLWNRARSLVFSTAPSPLLAELTRQNLVRARNDEAGRLRLWKASERLRARLREHGLVVRESSVGPIIPVLLGKNERAVAAAKRLAEWGILAQAIRPPTVPEGTARLRLTASAVLTDAEVDFVAAHVAEACAPFPPQSQHSDALQSKGTPPESPRGGAV
jgi:8-amino-7-oxononanoate synthase